MWYDLKNKQKCKQNLKILWLEANLTWNLDDTLPLKFHNFKRLKKNPEDHIRNDKMLNFLYDIRNCTWHKKTTHVPKTASEFACGQKLQISSPEWALGWYFLNQ